MDKSRVESTIFFIEKISFSLKLFSGHFYGQSFIKTVRGPWEKMIDLTTKLGEINDIEHNKGSKIYRQNQVILDCIMPSIPLTRAEQKIRRIC